MNFFRSKRRYCSWPISLPLASQLNPPPLDLAVHVPLHPDGAFFSFIKWGVEGTAMPSFAERLEDEQIWHIVNFIQTIRP